MENLQSFTVSKARLFKLKDDIIFRTLFRLTSGSDRFPAITKNSTALSTQPESDMPGSITGNNLQIIR